MVFHGNNKTAAEMEQAVRAGVGLIVVDNLDEIPVLDGVARSLYGRHEEMRTKVRGALRLNPGVDVHTHAKIQTGVVDSKFGLPIWSVTRATAVEAIVSSDRLRLAGYHMHLGSQLHETAAMSEALDKQIAFAAGMAEPARASCRRSCHRVAGSGSPTRSGWTRRTRPAGPRRSAQRSPPHAPLTACQSHS
jgi:diaminopimelate decarboxylase